MANPITPSSPLPFYGYTQTISNATVEVLTTQPYSNTKDVVIYNPDDTAILTVAVVPLVNEPAGAVVTFRTTTRPIPQPGDSVTIDGVVLTAVASATPGVDEFSVPGQATSPVITVTGYPLAGTQQIVFSKTVGDDTFSLAPLIGTAGGGGVNEFDITAGSANAVAASIAAAVNALVNAYAPEYVWASAVGATVAFAAGNDYLGTEGNGIKVTITSTGSIITPDVTLVGGVDAANNNDFSLNFAIAVNSFSAISTAWQDGYSTVNLVAVPLGTAGNAITLSESTGNTRIGVSGATFSGGVDAVPTSLTYGTVIPPDSSFTFNIGSEGNRQPLATDTFWATNAGSGLGIAVSHTGAGNVDINITYVQNRGFTGEPST